MPWDYVIILAILAVIVPWRSSLRVRDLLNGPDLFSSQRISLYLFTIVFQWMVVAVILWRCVVHHLSWATLGVALPYPLRSVAVAGCLSVVLVLNQVYAMRRIAMLPYDRRGLVPRLAEKLLPRASNEAFVGVFLVLTVAICEEFIYRGFVESIFASVSGSALAGALISAAFFSSAHLYQGRRGLITTFAVALIFSAARISTNSLFPSIVIHFAVDLSAGLAAWKFQAFRQNPMVLAILESPPLGVSSLPKSMDLRGVS